MNPRLLKLVLVWNAVLTAVLFASLLVNANFAIAANDPPVKVFTSAPQHAGGVDGSSTDGNTTITSDTTWSSLTSVSVNFGTQTHNHQCVAVASADVVNPFSGGAHNAYRFDIALDTFTNDTDTGTGRTLDFINSADGQSTQTVTTTRTFFNIPNGTHTIRLLARKFTGAPNATASDASMSVICLKPIQ